MSTCVVVTSVLHASLFKDVAAHNPILPSFVQRIDYPMTEYLTENILTHVQRVWDQKWQKVSVAAYQVRVRDQNDAGY